VREDTAAVASLVKKYAAQNARAEAEAIAAARKRNGPLPVIAFPA
jgi:hypothetical protein